MNNEEKKQYLRRYQAAKKRAKRIQEEIEELRSSKTSPVGLRDGMPHGSGTSDLSGYAARLDALVRELEAENRTLRAYINGVERGLRAKQPEIRIERCDGG